MGIDRRTDVEYRSTSQTGLALDVVRPSDDVVRPLLVHVHGGGWRRGEKGYARAERLARAGLVVASLEYRLSGQAQFPAAVRDVAAGVAWLRDRAASFGVDADRVALLGESAGGHLATLLGSAPDDPTVRPDDVSAAAVADVAAIVSVSGIYDLHLEGQCEAPVTSAFLGGSCEERPERATAASPIARVDGEEPPTLLYHGTDDEAVAFEQARRYRDELADAGATVELYSAEGGGHLLGDDAAAFLQRQTAFLATHLDVERSDRSDGT